ncbi:MAG: glutaredoxin 3 [Rhodospirillaceae bacterium]|nr:glutaredoxin 3 [Rhodospirillaceae bacterium]
MATVEIYTTLMCPFCSRALSLLRQKGVDYKEVDVTFRPNLRRAMAERAGARSVPQIWIDDRHIGGCDELHALDVAGELDPMLAQGAQ